MINTDIAMKLPLVDRSIKSSLVDGQPINGVELKPLVMNRDTRGSFTEVFQNYWNTCIEPCQWSVVSSGANVFRGCHLHLRHDEYYCLLQGEVTLGLRDERPESSTFGNWQLYRLYGEDMAALSFPAGLIHGWYFHCPSVHLQAVSESFIDYGTDDNHGVHWSDPALEIPWGFSDPILAERAKNFGGLKTLQSSIRLKMR